MLSILDAALEGGSPQSIEKVLLSDVHPHEPLTTWIASHDVVTRGKDSAPHSLSAHGLALDPACIPEKRGSTYTLARTTQSIEDNPAKVKYVLARGACEKITDLKRSLTQRVSLPKNDVIFKIAPPQATGPFGLFSTPNKLVVAPASADAKPGSSVLVRRPRGSMATSKAKSNTRELYVAAPAGEEAGEAIGKVVLEKYVTDLKYFAFDVTVKDENGAPRGLVLIVEGHMLGWALVERSARPGPGENGMPSSSSSEDPGLMSLLECGPLLARGTSRLRMRMTHRIAGPPVLRLDVAAGVDVRVVTSIVVAALAILRQHRYSLADDCFVQTDSYMDCMHEDAVKLE